MAAKSEFDSFLDCNSSNAWMAAEFRGRIMKKPSGLAAPLG